jgi:small subunit ribosomal protein S7
MRKSKPKKRILLPDPKYTDIEVTRFVNNMMYQGKKSLAFNIFYDALNIVEQKTKIQAKLLWKYGKKHWRTSPRWLR